MKDTTTKTVKIGCFGGFWGDSMALAVGQFLRSAEGDSLDYLVSDYLAEVTMCLLAKRKANGGDGFIRDFVTHVWKPFGATIQQKGIKVVVNAGGIDPLGLKEAIEKATAEFKDSGVKSQVKVAAVYGDDVSAEAKAQMTGGGSEAAIESAFRNFSVDGGTGIDSLLKPAYVYGTGENGAPKKRGVSPDKLLSCNAYVGAGGIVAALADGATVVVTGRCVDSAMVLGPLAFEHKWKLGQGAHGALAPQDYDLLSQGTLAGHLVECGCQSTGGNFTDWEMSMRMKGATGRHFQNPGFPIVEVGADGKIVLTKPRHTGGVVSRLSVTEQMVYEIGDPASYRVADVTCDWRNTSVSDVDGEPNRVLITGAKGYAPSGCYKVTATFADGYLTAIPFVVVGPHAATKAQAVATSLIARAEATLASMGQPGFIATRIERYGAEEVYGPAKEHAREVVVRIAARHENPKALMLLAASVPSASTAMTPGIFTLTTGTQTPGAAVALRSCLIPAPALKVSVHVGDVSKSMPMDARPPLMTPDRIATVEKVGRARGAPVFDEFDSRPGNSVEDGPLESGAVGFIACCRSGDKADAANIGVVCRDPHYYRFLVQHLTAPRVKKYFAHWLDHPLEGESSVTRHLLPGSYSMNFVLNGALGGGGLVSLKGDKQGKSLGSVMLSMPLEVPQKWIRAYEEHLGAIKQRIRARL